MSPTASWIKIHRSRPREVRTYLRLCRYAAAAATLVLMSGCSRVSENTGAPAQPSVSAASPSKVGPPTRPADPEVRATQDYLARLGYYRGPIDGISGPKTRTAVANYQTDSGLPPDGKVSRDLIARLAAMPPTPALRDKVDRASGPIYEPGDAYIYTDGQVETVLWTGEHRVEWQDAKGQRWLADTDFTVPTRRSDPGTKVASRQSFTWPIRVGAMSSYIVKTEATDRTDQKAMETWHCVVEGHERTAVFAGTFDSYKIVCRLDGGPLGAAQSRTWYFAPTIGHYVRYIENAGNQVRSRDLVAVSPGELGWPPEARTGLEWAVSHALETEPAGRAVPWQSSAVAARFVIEPGPKVDVGHSEQCRRFTQTRISADSTKRVYPRVACHVQNQWRLLGSV
jgi:peptidoglycan hydrolase-like protein with peptidoglycan-binding domain